MQLTKELLSTFIDGATTKVQQTLSNDASLTPFVFANSALLWLVPESASHPLRRAIGLSTPFILISGLSEPAKKEYLHLQHFQNITCGAEPLETWRCLTTQAEDNVKWNSKHSYDWGCQRLLPLERNKARMLTAQYAQILPQLSFGGDAERLASESLALPMLVLTRDVDAVASPKCFYLSVFPPTCSSAFANVIAIRRNDRVGGLGAVEMLRQDKAERVRMQCWAEYDLLGTPVSSEHSIEAPLQTRSSPMPDSGDDVSMHSADESGHVAFVNPEIQPTLLSYVSVHGVWTSEPMVEGSCNIELPPLPPPATQWILELMSMPLAQDPDANRSLWALRMEIKRLDTWCQSWTNSAKWIEGKDEDAFELHEWQSSRNRSDLANPSKAAAQKGVLEKAHREAFGSKIDNFIDTSIYDAPRSTALGRLGHTDDIRALSGFPVREDLDFTERVWNLSHDAHDDNDLSEIIAAIAEGLETKKLQPYIHQNNRTPLGQLIRDALQVAHLKTLADDEAEKERLAGQLDLWIDERPLDAFVHVGAHKLRADFWFYLVGGHLATPRQVEPFVDPEIEPERLVPRLWLLLRVLEVWWLVQQAVPGMPQQFVRQVVGTVLTHFSKQLDSIDNRLQQQQQEQQQQSNVDDDSENRKVNLDLVATYSDPLKLTLYLPMYSTDVHEFATSIAEGFPPARFVTVAFSDWQSSGDGSGTGSTPLASRHKMLYFTKTPALVDMHFAAEDEVESDGEDSDEYVVFEAK